MSRVVIVGYGMAGARLATELQSRSADLKITVLGAEPHRAYNRILLSNLLAGKVGEPDVALAEAAGHGLDIRPGVEVTAIDRRRRTVHSGRGDIIEYDRLVLATGSRAVVPPILDPDHLPERVAVFRTLDDCRRILAVAQAEQAGTAVAQAEQTGTAVAQAEQTGTASAAGARTALVLGGGLLGLEAARGLATRGLEVQVVHLAGHLMDRQLDPAAGAVLARTLAGLGITAHLDAIAEAVSTDAGGVTLALAGGERLRADLLVLACGVRPETALARAAGLAVDRAIVVDERMRTSDPHIFAIGDCAQYDGVVSGLVGPAWEQARVVAQLLAGDDPAARYRPTPPVTRLKAAGIDLAAMGEPAGVAKHHEELSFADPARGTYAKLVIDGDRLAGAILLGDNPAIGTVIQLFDRGAPVPADRRALLLGRAIGGPAAAAQSPALMPDAATVCQCNTVSKGALVRCWRSGARTVEEVVAGTRATTGCGTCRDAVAGIVDWLSTADSVDGPALGWAGGSAA
jgi:assimilatory nitrate reductase electron transfer subunit